MHEFCKPCFNLSVYFTGAVARFNSYFGSYERAMLLSYVSCSGSQSSLLDCSSSIPSSSCDKYDIAGVTCEGNAYITFKIV